MYPGLTPLTVQNSTGKHTVNFYVEAAAPAHLHAGFIRHRAGRRAQSAGTDSVTADNPLHAGDTVALYVTGLGLTTPSNGLDVAVQQPTVTSAGTNALYRLQAPRRVSLDSIKSTAPIPSGFAASLRDPVVVTSGNRISNTATLAIQ